MLFLIDSNGRSMVQDDENDIENNDINSNDNVDHDHDYLSNSYAVMCYNFKNFLEVREDPLTVEEKRYVCSKLGLYCFQQIKQFQKKVS